MAVAERSSASFQVQLKAAFQQIRTSQAKNLRLQSTSFRLEAALQQYINKDFETSAHPEQPEPASLSAQYDSVQQPTVVVDADTQHHTTVEATQSLEDTTPLGRPTLDLFSTHSSNDSVSFIPVVTFTLSEKAPGRPDSKFDGVSMQACTKEPQAVVAEELLATVPSLRPLQPPAPVAAMVSPFAACSHRAFSDCSSADRNPPVSTKALLSFGSDNSTAGDLLTGLSVSQAGHMDDDWSLVGRVDGPGRCDHWLSDKLCHTLSSNVSASSLIDDSTDYRPGAVCVVQQRGLGRYTLVVWQKGDSRRPKKHGVFASLSNALGMCFCSNAGSALRLFAVVSGRPWLTQLWCCRLVLFCIMMLMRMLLLHLRGWLALIARSTVMMSSGPCVLQAASIVLSLPQATVLSRSCLQGTCYGVSMAAL